MKQILCIGCVKPFEDHELLWTDDQEHLWHYRCAVLDGLVELGDYLEALDNHWGLRSAR